MPATCFMSILFSTNFSTINEIELQDSWPTLLSNKLGYELKSFASAGISNYGILNTIYNNSNFDKNDIVIIGWSFVHRCRWAHHEYNKWHFFGAGPIDSIMKTFQDNHTHEKITYNRTSELYFDEVFNYIKLIINTKFVQ